MYDTLTLPQQCIVEYAESIASDAHSAFRNYRHELPRGSTSPIPDDQRTQLMTSGHDVHPTDTIQRAEAELRVLAFDSLAASAGTQAAIVAVYDYVDDLLQSGRFDLCDEMLKS